MKRDNKTSQYRIEFRPIAGLIPYARTHSDAQVAQIAASICEFGWTNPVLVDGEGGIIAGHGRVLAARKLGQTEVPTIALAHLSEAQKRAYVLADNKLALNAGWDDAMLALELGDLKDLDFDISMIGFSDIELANILADRTEGLTDPDDAPEVHAEAVSVLGDACHAIELSPAYVDVAVRRWQSFTGETATLEGDGRTFADIEAERVGVADAA